MKVNSKLNILLMLMILGTVLYALTVLALYFLKIIAFLSSNVLLTLIPFLVLVFVCVGLYSYINYNSKQCDSIQQLTKAPSDKLYLSDFDNLSSDRMKMVKVNRDILEQIEACTDDIKKHLSYISMEFDKRCNVISQLHEVVSGRPYLVDITSRLKKMEIDYFSYLKLYYLNFVSHIEQSVQYCLNYQFDYQHFYELLTSRYVEFERQYSWLVDLSNEIKELKDTVIERCSTVVLHDRGDTLNKHFVYYRYFADNMFEYHKTVLDDLFNEQCGRINKLSICISKERSGMRVSESSLCVV